MDHPNLLVNMGDLGYLRTVEQLIEDTFHVQ